MGSKSISPPSIVRDAFRIARRPLSDEEERSLGDFGRFAREVLEPAALTIDRASPPVLKRGRRGSKTGERVELSPLHRRMLDRLFGTGMATGATGPAEDWPVSFAYMHEVAEIGMLCSATVTLATVYSLAKWGSSQLQERFLPGLLEKNGRAGGATWATEHQGGSDIGANTTSAKPGPDDRRELTGEKFFCSNVGASSAVVTARPEGGSEGIHGIRLFFVPARRPNGRANWRVRRLKEKLGTVTVPTGEVSLDRTEAYALGTPEAGVLPVVDMLNVSRVANAVGSAAALQRAWEIAWDHASRRTAFGRPLPDHPLSALDLATLAAESDAASLLAFDAVFRLSRAGQERPPFTEATHLLRFTTHIAKLVTAEQAVRGTQLAMEILGGIGYLEEGPLAKLVRDALVTPVWEGGANIQALNARDVMQRERIQREWQSAAGRAASRSPSSEVRRFISTRIALLENLTAESDAKHVARTWGDLRQLTLLVARSHRNPENEVYEARADLFARLRSSRPGVDYPPNLVRRSLGLPSATT